MLSYCVKITKFLLTRSLIRCGCCGLSICSSTNGCSSIDSCHPTCVGGYLHTRAGCQVSKGTAGIWVIRTAGIAVIQAKFGLLGLFSIQR
ncbi:hypothetical protein ABVT39_005042 [Epinephelus coioides]